MPQSLFIAILVAMRATGTGIGGVTLCFTGRCRYLARVVMSQRIGCYRKGKGAVGGSFPLVIICTCICTGCRLGSRLGVVRRVQLRQSHRCGLGALGTSSRQSAGSTCGRVLGCLIAVGMPCSAGVAILIAMRAAGTGIGGVALRLAGGGRYLAGIVVP